MLPEIQATLARPPATAQTMMRGVGLSYVIVILAYYGVAVSGYAAFGAAVSSGEGRAGGEGRLLYASAGVGWLGVVGAVGVWGRFVSPFSLHRQPNNASQSPNPCCRCAAQLQAARGGDGGGKPDGGGARGSALAKLQRQWQRQRQLLESQPRPRHNVLSRQQVPAPNTIRLPLPAHCNVPHRSMQVFAMPIFDAAETAVRRGMRSPPRPLVLRLLLRSAYVAVVTLVACALPFFGELM